MSIEGWIVVAVIASVLHGLTMYAIGWRSGYRRGYSDSEAETTAERAEDFEAWANRQHG